MRRRARPGGTAARRTVALVACLLLAAVTGCGGNRPGPSGSTGSGVPSTLAEQPGGRDLIARLRQGGHVIFIRHAATEPTQDDPRPDLADPRTQRNLSDDGREQARQLGRAIRRLGIPVGTVLASPYARTRETAELAFGRDRVRVTRDLLNEAFPDTDDEDLARRMQRLLAMRPPAGRTRCSSPTASTSRERRGSRSRRASRQSSHPATRAAPGWSRESPPRNGRHWGSTAERTGLGAEPARWRGPSGGRPPTARNGWWPGRGGLRDLVPNGCRQARPFSRLTGDSGMVEEGAAGPDCRAGLPDYSATAQALPGPSCSWPSEGRPTAATVLARRCWSRSVRAV